MNLENKSIVFIPPNGEILRQDFALYRIINYFTQIGVETTLLIVNDIQQTLLYNTKIKKLKNKEEILTHLYNNKYDLIFHRSWMHRYPFAALLAKKFNNVISYIKDWHDISKDEYEFAYDTVDDIDAIRDIFVHSKLVLSHYSKGYTNRLAVKYNITNKKFIFFPEYSLVENFYVKKNINYSNENNCLLMAGGGVHTSVPNNIIPGKSLFNMMISISLQKININMVIVEKSYNRIHSNRKMYLDYLYEDKFNKYFNIKKGSELDKSIGKDYSFGMFTDSIFPRNAKYLHAEEYAVTSKFAFYLECGLPVLVNKRFKTLSRIVKKNDIGIVFSDDDLNEFKKVLNIRNKRYKRLVHNVYKFREKFTYNKKTIKPLLDIVKKEK